MTPVTRQTPVPPPPPQQQQTAPSPYPMQQQIQQQQVRTPAALPSPAPTPKQEHDEAVVLGGQEHSRAHSTSVQSDASSVTAAPVVAPEYKMPYYPELPWYSNSEADFPPRARRRRRRRQNLDEGDAVIIAPRNVAEDDMQGPTPEEVSSETSTIAAPSEPETPATSQAPSESDFSQVSTPATPAQATLPSPKATPTQTSQHVRRDTRTAIAVPNIPGIQRSKPSPPAASKPEVQTSQAEATTPSEEAKAVTTVDETTGEEATAPVSLPPKPAPKSWAELVKRNAPAATAPISQPNGIIINGAGLSKSASLADALKQYSTQIDAKLSFLEPRGLVNTGNVCYMNSVRTTTVTARHLS